MISAKKSQWMSSVMVIATIMVVITHVDDICGAKHCPFIRWIGGPLTVANTPNFFFLSGFFLALRYGETKWWSYAVRKRFFTLIVPFLLWNILFFAVDLLLPIIKAGCMHSEISAARQYTYIKSLWGVCCVLGADIFSFPYVAPLWYVRCLFAFILLSYFVFGLIRRFQWMSLLAISTLFFVHSGLWYWFPSLPMKLLPTFNLQGLIFFLLGSWSAIHFKDEEWIPSKYFAVASLGMWVIGAVVMFFCPQRLYGVFVPCVAAISVFSVHLIVRAYNICMPKFFIVNAFFVYVCHAWVMRVCSRIFPSGLISPLLIVACGICLPLALAFLLRKICPALAALLTGGR